MKNTKVIGVLLLIFAAITVLAMIIDNNDLWSVYNYLTLVLTISSGVILIKQK